MQWEKCLQQQRELWKRKIRLAWYVLNKGKQFLTDEHILTLAAFVLTLNYYEERDEEDGSNHADSFKRVYLKKDTGYLRNLSSGKLLEILNIEIIVRASGKIIRRIFDKNNDFAKDVIMSNLKIKPKDITPKITNPTHGRGLGKSGNSISRHTKKYINKLSSNLTKLKIESFL